MSNSDTQCSSCGATNFPGDLRCRQCSAPLGAGPQNSSWSPPPQPPPGWGPPQGQPQPPPVWGQQPPPPPGYPPNAGYGAPPYGPTFGAGAYGPDVEEAKKTARNSLIAGVVGLFCLGFILGILAIKWGNDARKSLSAAGVSDSQGLALAGMILGGLDIAGWVIMMAIRLANL